MKIKSKKDMLKKYRCLLGLPVLLLAVWAILFYIYRGVVVPAAGTAVTQTCIDADGEYSYLFEASDGKLELAQTFFVTTPKLTGLGMVVQSGDGQPVEKVEAHVLLLDGMTKEPLFDDDIILENVLGQTHLNVIFEEPLEDTQDMYMEMVIRFSGDCAERIQVLGTSDLSYEYLECQINQVSIPQAVGLEQYIVYGHFILGLFKLFVALFSAFLVIFYWMVFIRKGKPENIYLFTVLVLGLFYCFILVPFSVPDESMHASSVYRITNDILGVEETGNPETIYKRYDDAAIPLNNDCNLNQYYVVYSRLFEMAENTELIETGYRDTGVTPLMYAPAVVGILLGRLIGLGPIPMYMLARILMLVFFALMTWWAMKKLPFGKAALFIIGVLPMTLQQAASVSYDAVVNAVTILFTAVCFQMAFSGEKIRRRDVLLTVILGFLLIFAKSGAYLPLILLLAMIPVSKLGASRKKWISLGIFAGVLAVVFLVNNMGLVGGSGGTAMADASEQYYSISYLLKNPSTVFNLGMGTLLFNSSYYISTMIGQRLSFLNIVIDDLVVFIYLALMAAALLKRMDEPMYMTGKDKVFMGLSVLGSAAMVILSMLLFITPLGSGVVLGVQGRYFIPIIWIILMLLRNRTILLRKDISYGLIFTAVITHALVFAYVIREIFMF